MLRAESGSYNLPLRSNADLSDEGGASGGGASGGGASADGGGRENDGGDLSGIRLALQLYAAHVYRLGTVYR